jgi:coproporphyrinogen III oxidase-like Fe-S oxidoreductase
MRSILSWAVGLVAVAAAAPAPQDIDFDLIYALPNPTYSVASDQTAQTVTYTPSLI